VTGRADSASREDRAKFALIVSALCGPVGVVISPVVYLRPGLVLGDVDRRGQTTLDEFA